MPSSSQTASGWSPLSQYTAKRARCGGRVSTASSDPRPNGRDYADPFLFARDYEAWLNRRGETLSRPVDADDTEHHAHNFYGPGEGESR